MNPIFVGRQPIVDNVEHVVAYELLFREDAAAEHAVYPSRSFACMHVIANTFASMGVRAVLGGCRAFVNVDDELLLSDLVEALPVERVVLELLEDISVDDRLLDRCRALRQRGFTIALDDFVLDDPREPLLEIVDWVKVDLPTVAEADLEPLVRRLKGLHVRALAEKVETRPQFEACCAAGFDLFQGFFFARPDVLEGAPLDPHRLALLSLLQQLNGDQDTDRIVETVKRNTALGLSLLRLVNSAAFATRTEIASLEGAVNFLGRRQLARWVVVLLYAGAESVGLRNALLQTAAHRGRLMENLSAASARAPGEEPERAFLAGMLSLVDVLFARPLDEVVGELGLEPGVRAALLEREGRLGALISLAEAAERADWPNVDRALAGFDLDLTAFREQEERAYGWLHGFVGDASEPSSAPTSAASSEAR